MISIPITTTTKTVTVRITPRDGEWLGNTPGTALGTAAAGISGMAAREDHVHPMPTAAAVGADPAGSAVAARSFAVQRENHTGTQPISSVDGLQAAIDNFAALLASDTADLDTLQEIVDFIRINREDLAALTIASIAGLQAALDASVQRANHTGTQPAATISDFHAVASAAAPVQSVAGKNGAVTLSPSDAGADPAGTAATAAAAAQAHAVQRANHTGTQAVSTIAGFNAAAAAAAPVQSVAGKNGAVTLSPGDVGADPAGTAATAAAAAQAYAVQRANHTGTQAISTITGLQTALDNLAALLASDESTLDTVQEIVDFIQLNRSDLDSLTIASIAGLQTALNAAVQRANHTGTQAISTITGLQAALDAAVQRVNHTGTQSADSITDGTSNKAFTAAEKTKLAGIATGATVANAANVGSAIAGVTTKATPVDADSLWMTDSAASNAAKRIPFANLRTWVTGVINTWWGSLTTAIKTTGDQEKSGVLTVTSPIVSTGTPSLDTHLLNRKQAELRRFPFLRPTEGDQWRQRLDYFAGGSLTSPTIGDWNWSANLDGGTLTQDFSTVFSGRGLALRTAAVTGSRASLYRFTGGSTTSDQTAVTFLLRNFFLSDPVSLLNAGALWVGWRDSDLDSGSVGRFQVGFDWTESENILIKQQGSDGAALVVTDTGVPIPNNIAWAVPTLSVTLIGKHVAGYFGGTADKRRLIISGPQPISTQVILDVEVPHSGAVYNDRLFVDVETDANAARTVVVQGVELYHPGPHHGLIG